MAVLLLATRTSVNNKALNLMKVVSMLVIFLG